MKRLFCDQGRKCKYYGVFNNTFLLLFGLMLVLPILLCYKYVWLHKRKMGCSKGGGNHDSYLGFSSSLSSPESRGAVWLEKGKWRRQNTFPAGKFKTAASYAAQGMWPAWQQNLPRLLSPLIAKTAQTCSGERRDILTSLRVTHTSLAYRLPSSSGCESTGSGGMQQKQVPQVTVQLAFFLSHLTPKHHCLQFSRCTSCLSLSLPKMKWTQKGTKRWKGDRNCFARPCLLLGI